MPLPDDDKKLRELVDFVISRWKLEHDWKNIKFQAIQLSIQVTREDFLEIVWSYIRLHDPNKQAQTGD